MTVAETNARITQIKTVDLPGVRTSIQELVSGEHAEYWLDSGQSSQRVKRLSLTELREYEQSLESELSRLENSLGSSGQIGIPNF